MDQKYIDLLIHYGINCLVAMLILAGGWYLSAVVGRIVHGRVFAIGKDETLATVMGKVVRAALLVLTIVVVLSQFGVQTTSLVALLGAAGLAIGLALQGTLSNVAAGVMLLVFRPFKTGDYVDIDGIGGTVKEMGLFITHLNTPDNVAVLVPNNRIWGSPIKNFATNDNRRLDLVFSIAYEDDIGKAMDLIKEKLAADQRVLADPAPVVVVGVLGESSVDLWVRPWVHRTVYWDLRFDLTRSIKEAFDGNGITIPFPQRVVHMEPAASAG